MDTKVIHECTTGALAGKVSFPDTVKQLISIGVERYCADLTRMEKVFYAKNHETALERLPVPNSPVVAEQFDEKGVLTAIRAIQQKQIDYPEFLRLIMAGGCASYTVFIDGRHAAYYGRKGECYVEHFPSPK